MSDGADGADGADGDGRDFRVVAGEVRDALPVMARLATTVARDAQRARELVAVAESTSDEARGAAAVIALGRDRSQALAHGL